MCFVHNIHRHQNRTHHTPKFCLAGLLAMPSTKSIAFLCPCAICYSISRFVSVRTRSLSIFLSFIGSIGCECECLCRIGRDRCVCVCVWCIKPIPLCERDLCVFIPITKKKSQQQQIHRVAYKHTQHSECVGTTALLKMVRSLSKCLNT